ncbi:MAG: hypothetical protein ACYDIA_23495 [Candidatus Humimicrobiaceae bacterium]
MNAITTNIEKEISPSTNTLSMPINILENKSSQFWDYLSAYTFKWCSTPSLHVLTEEDLVSGNKQSYPNFLENSEAIIISLTSKIFSSECLNAGYWTDSVCYTPVYLSKIESLYGTATSKIDHSSNKIADESILSFAEDLFSGIRDLTQEESEIIDNHLLLLYKEL